MSVVCALEQQCKAHVHHNVRIASKATLEGLAAFLPAGYGMTWLTHFLWL
jgi:hypothetical protein